jgi:hypothetical protein
MQQTSKTPIDGSAIAAAVRLPAACSAHSVATPEAHGAVEAVAVEAAGVEAAAVEAATSVRAPRQRQAQKKLTASSAKAAPLAVPLATPPNRAEAKVQAKEGRQARPAIG